MGTDIHMFAEVRSDGRWKKVGWVFDDGDGGMTDHPYDGRNYRLFAALAGVRNGYGEAVTPISTPRGLPADVSPEVQSESHDDDYSHSWLLLSELLAYDWNQVVEPFIVDHSWARTLEALRRRGGPDDVRIVFWFDS